MVQVLGSAITPGKAALYKPRESPLLSHGGLLLRECPLREHGRSSLGLTSPVQQGRNFRRSPTRFWQLVP
jgi:hypothetical protein